MSVKVVPVIKAEFVPELPEEATTVPLEIVRIINPMGELSIESSEIEFLFLFSKEVEVTGFPRLQYFVGNVVNFAVYNPLKSQGQMIYFTNIPTNIGLLSAVTEEIDLYGGEIINIDDTEEPNLDFPDNFMQPEEVNITERVAPDFTKAPKLY